MFQTSFNQIQADKVVININVGWDVGVWGVRAFAIRLYKYYLQSPLINNDNVFKTQCIASLQ